MKQIKRDNSKPKELKWRLSKGEEGKNTHIMLKLSENCCVLHFKTTSEMDHKNSK